MAKKKGSKPKKGVSLRLTRRGVALWLFLIFGISAWMFMLGILVGRETVPLRFDIDKLQKELAELKRKALKTEIQRYKIDTGTLETHPELSFYEALKTNSDIFDLPVQPQKEKQDSPPAGRVPEPNRTQAAEPTVEAPRRDAEKGTAGQGLCIQVASVKNPEDADRLVENLKKKGFSAYRTITKVPGKGIWFRVRVGPLGSRAEADAVRSRLKKDKMDGIISGC